MPNKGDYDMATPRADAGIGTSITIKKWGLLEKVKPLTIRLDMPIYLSHAPALVTNNFQFNWLLGIARAF
jgi:aminopeptidase N